MRNHRMRRVTRLFSAAAVFSGVAILGGGELLAQTTPAPQPTICNRSCWNATSNSLPSTTGLNRAIIHHTAGTYGNQSLNHSKNIVKNIQSYHKSLGWLDIGYHFLTDALGNIFQGRYGSMTASTYYRGAHDGNNSSSYGFSALGNYQSNTFTTAGRNAMWDVIAWRMPSGWSPYGSGTYNGKTVGRTDGHKSVKSTACPGTNIWATIGTNYSGGTARNAIAARRSGGGGGGGGGGDTPPSPVNGIVVDNHHSGFSASSNWVTSTSVDGYLGTNYHARATESTSDAATWSFQVKTRGDYNVYASWTAHSNRATSAPYIIDYTGGQSDTVNVNQTTNGGKWNLLGRYRFGGTNPTNHTVRLSCWTGSGNYVVADAIRLVPDVVWVDNHHSGFSASSNWPTATWAEDKYGSDYRYRNTEAIGDAASWTAYNIASGSHQLQAWWSQASNRATAAPYRVNEGSWMHANQTTNGGKWNTLGTQSLSSGNSVAELSCWTTSGDVVIADAFRWRRQ